MVSNQCLHCLYRPVCRNTLGDYGMLKYRYIALLCVCMRVGGCVNRCKSYVVWFIHVKLPFQEIDKKGYLDVGPGAGLKRTWKQRILREKSHRKQP